MQVREFCHQQRRMMFELLANHPKITPIHIVNSGALITFLGLLEEFEQDVSNQELSADNIQPFIDFLAYRWSRIIDTDLIYSHSPNEPVNVLCLGLAEQLELVCGVDRYSLLMPSVKVLGNEIIGIELRGGELAINDVVLCDQSERVIDVAACLEFACEDGVLKHTSLFANQARELTRREKARVISHSTQSRELYIAIRQRAHVTLRGRNIGASLNKLINALLGGGAKRHADGSEFNAGKKANEGIIQFSQWLELLTPANKEKLFACTAQGLNSTIGELWDRLARPADTDYHADVYCVEIIAGNLRQIVQANKWLYDYNPVLEPTTMQQSIHVLDVNMHEKKRALMQAMRDKNRSVMCTYGARSRARLAALEYSVELFNQYLTHPALDRAEPEIRDRLIFEMMLHATDRVKDDLYSAYTVYFLKHNINHLSNFWRSQIDSYPLLMRVIVSMPPYFRSSVCFALNETLASLMPTLDQCCELLIQIPESDQCNVIEMLEEHFITMLTTDKTVMYRLMSACALQNRWPVLGYFVEHYFYLLAENNIFFDVMHYLPAIDRAIFVYDIRHLLSNLIQTIDHLSYVLDILSAPDYEVWDNSSVEIENEVRPHKKALTETDEPPEQVGEEVSCYKQSTPHARTLRIAAFIESIKAELPRIIRSESDYRKFLFMLPLHVDKSDYIQLFPYDNHDHAAHPHQASQLGLFGPRPMELDESSAPQPSWQDRCTIL